MAAPQLPLTIREGPHSLSRSVEKSMGCERYFMFRYLIPDQPKVGSRDGLRATFIEYRTQYIRHLRELQVEQDPAWVRSWVAGTPMQEHIAELIRADAADFKIRPNQVFATELFISLAEDFTAIEVAHPRKQAECKLTPHSRFHGILDHVEVDGDTARILDVQTGYGTTNLRDYEAVHAAGLLFAAMPQINDIDFSWSFARAGNSTIPFAFNRRFDYPWIMEQMQRRYQALTLLIERARTGVRPSVNATAGLCRYCPYTCPLRAAAEQGLFIDRPLQTDQDAIALARRIHAASIYVLRGRELLSSYLEPDGSLSLGNNLVCQVRAGVQSEFRLDKVAELLGLELPEKSPAWDVPIEGLRVGSTALKRYAKTKMRSGLIEKLMTIARTRPNFRLHIGKPGADEGEEE